MEQWLLFRTFFQASLHYWKYSINGLCP